MKIDAGKGSLFVLLALALLIGSGLVDPAFAGPGGIFKAATHTIWGQIGIGLLCVILSPLLIWYYGKRLKHVNKMKKDLAALAAVYPQYNLLDLRDKTTEIFRWVWSAWSQEKMSLASHLTTNWYWQNQQLVLDQWQRDGLENVCSLDCIKNIVPLYVEHREENNGEGSRVVFEISAMVTDYLKERSTGNVVKGDKKVGDLETIWTLVWQDGAWKLNLIEDSSEELSYMGMPNKLPAAIQQAGKPPIKRRTKSVLEELWIRWTGPDPAAKQHLLALYGLLPYNKFSDLNREAAFFYVS